MARELESFDPEVYELIKQEEKKQEEKIDLIASENFTVPAVREALGSVFVHKYAEGQAGKRYYEGNQFADELEMLCKKRAGEVFSLPEDWSVNVQALAGSNANLGIFNGLLEPGDTILSMYLPDGGHLSHGWSFPEGGGMGSEVGKEVYLGGERKISIVSKMFKVIQYKTDPETSRFDYDKILEIAKEYKPKMLVSGGTAYAREIDHAAMAGIAHEVGALYLADISHEAGLVAGGANASPVGVADVVMFTTHKTLRGPRGAVILGRSDLMEKVDFGIFPGLQGGPFLHSIAAIAVALKDAGTPAFQEYASQVVKNAQALAENLKNLGYDIVTNGTDKHLVLMDLRKSKIRARTAAVALDRAGIILNRNSVPQETGSSMNPSGLRMGTPTVTTRGMKESDMEQIAKWIDRVLRAVSPFSDLKVSEFKERLDGVSEIKEIEKETRELCSRFPLDF